MPEAMLRLIVGLGGQQVDKTLTITGDHPNRTSWCCRPVLPAR